MARRLILLLVALLAGSALAGEKGTLPFPAGVSRHAYAGIRFTLHLPPDAGEEGPCSLLVGLHGAGATDQDFATWFEPLVAHDFVVCCPKSATEAWAPKDLERVRELVLHLLAVLPVDRRRMHGVGFSNGGANLHSVVFAEDLPFLTGCWMGSGFPGGKVPKRAKTEFAALAMAGEEDPFLGAAKATVKTLEGKVRRVDLETQPDLGHDIPADLMPFYYYWLRVMEGRFHPGDEESLPWHYDHRGALAEMAKEKRGGLFYFFDEKDEKDPDAKHAQNEVLLDPAVRALARQVVPAMVDAGTERGAAAGKEMEIGKTPAFAVLDAQGKILARFAGHVQAKDLAAALRKIVPGSGGPR